MDAPYVVKSAWLSKLGNGWWPSWNDRYFVLYSNGEFKYYLSDVVDIDSVEQGTIHLSSITGLQVATAIPGPERPGLIVKTESLHSKREYFLAAREGVSVQEMEAWVPAIMTLREGKVAMPEEEILMEFSMNSEEEEGKDVECILDSSNDRPPPQVLTSSPLVVERVDEPPVALVQGPNMEDVRAIEALGRSWDVSRRPMLEKTLVRTVNYFVGRSGERIRNLIDLSDGVVCVQLLRALGCPVEYDEPEGSRYSNVFKVATVSGAVNALGKHSSAASEVLSSGLIVNGNTRAIASFVWAALYLCWIKDLEFQGASGVGAIVSFAQSSVAGHEHVRLSDLSGSFLDGGYALSAIVDRWAPNSIDYQSIVPHQQLRNLERAFLKANEALHVPLLLDAADFSSATFDETSLVLYLSAFLKCVQESE